MKLFWFLLIWVVSGDVANLITVITYLGFLYFLLIHRVDFHGFINMGVPGLILSLIFILLYKKLLSSLFFILLNNLSVNSKGKFYYIRYVGGLIYLRDLILNIVL